MHRSTTPMSRLVIVLSALVAALTALALLARIGPAQAAFVQAGCTETSEDDAWVSEFDGAVAFDGTRVDGSADDIAQRLRAKAHASYVDNNVDDACGLAAEIDTGLTVGSGTTGAAPGTPVALTLALRLQGRLATAPPDAPWSTASAEGSAWYRVVDWSAYTGGEAEPVIARFEGAFGQNNMTQADTSSERSDASTWQLTTNVDEPQEYSNETTGSGPGAATADTGNLTATVHTIVGAHLEIRGRLSVLTTVTGMGSSATADFFDGLAVSMVPGPGYEGLELVIDGAEPINQPPSCTNGTASTDEDTDLAITVSCSDPDGDPLTYTVTDGPAQGSLSGIGADGSTTYTPGANWSGDDVFTFSANDGTAESDTATFSVTVDAVNDAPLCDNATASTTAGQPVTVTMTCTDPELGPLTYTMVTGPTNGSASAFDGEGRFVYTPAAGFSGTETLAATASDAEGGTAAATLTVTVVPVVSGPPTTKEDCQNGGWRTFTNPSFKNQGECLKFVSGGPGKGANGKVVVEGE
jgi:hypothetical protein